MLARKLLKGGGIARTYATLNPATSDSGGVLSNGNLTYTNNSIAAWRASTATLGKSTGKWYYEITLSQGTTFISGAWQTHVANNYIGQPSHGKAVYHLSGQKVSGGTLAAYFASNIVPGNIISVLLDMDNKTISFWKNGVDGGVAYSGLTGTYYPAVSVFKDGGGNAGHTVNFGASAFAYTPPAGYNHGVYL